MLNILISLFMMNSKARINEILFSLLFLEKELSYQYHLSKNVVILFASLLKSIIKYRPNQKHLLQSFILSM